MFAPIGANDAPTVIISGPPTYWGVKGMFIPALLHDIRRTNIRHYRLPRSPNLRGR